jgi:hypothetical protein
VAANLNSQHIAWADFDNDGDLDIYIANAGDLNVGNQPNFLYENQGDGTFQEVASSVGATGTTSEGMSGGVAIADWDADGALDVIISHGLSNYSQLSGPHEVLDNQGNSNHWLQIRLQGVASNRLGIGARVEIWPGDGSYQMREMSGGVHKFAQDEMLIHFGLGTLTHIDQLRVTWPGGAEQYLYNVGVDQRVTILEASGGPTPSPSHTHTPGTPTLTPTPTASPVAEEIIIDNQDPEFSTVGFWNTNSNSNYPFYGADFRYSPSGDGSNQATFRPEILSAGDYEVSFWFLSSSRMSVDVPYTINHSSGSTTIRVDQNGSVGGGYWYTLGTFTFDAGTAGSIVISNDASDLVPADAVRLVPR